MTELRRRA